MPRFFANGVDFVKVLVTQNENGEYYGLISNPDSLWRTTLPNFNSGKGLPKGYKKFSNGSHVSFKNEHAIDLSLAGGVVITSDTSIKINGHRSIKGYEKNPYGFEMVIGDIHPIGFHAKTKFKIGNKEYNWKSGDRVPAGQPICVIMTPEENLASGRFSVVNGKKIGFPAHFHFGTDQSNPKFDKTTVRDMILAPISMKHDFEVRIITSGKSKTYAFGSDETKARKFFDDTVLSLSETLTNVDMYDNAKLVASKKYVPAPQNPPQDPPPVEKMVALKESVYKEMIQNDVDQRKEIGVLTDMIKDLKKEIGGEDGNGGLNGTIIQTQVERNSAISDAKSIAEMLKTTYEPGQDWQLQKYKFEEAIAKMVTKDLTKAQLFLALIYKFTPKAK